MEEKKHPLRNVKVEVRPTAPVLKIVLIVLIAFSILALIALRWVHSGILEETRNLKDEAAAVEQANEDLKEKTDSLGSVQSVQDIAQEELGLVDPDTVILEPQS